MIPCGFSVTVFANPGSTYQIVAGTLLERSPTAIVDCRVPRELCWRWRETACFFEWQEPPDSPTILTDR